MGRSLKSLNCIRCAPSHFKYLFLLAIVCGAIFLFFTISNTTVDFFLSYETPTSPMDFRRSSIPESDEGFTINTVGCTIPGLRPFDDSIKKFITPPDISQCRYANISLLGSNDTHIWVIHERLQYYNVPDNVSFSCCYKPFYRPNTILDITSNDVDERVKYDTCVMFADYIEVANEFVKVSCSYHLKIIYESFFLFAPKKPFISYQAKEKKVNFTDLGRNLTNKTSYNVIVIGIDTVSRLNFYRTMPKTLTFLKMKGAIELLGYNKVGDNTFPNLTPMLMGIKDTDLKKTCWPDLRSSFDNCPIIWKWFKEAGYYTALGEDSAKLGTFNFGKMGFVGNPTDYYTHTFMHEAEINVGNNKDFNSFICMGNKYFYQVLLDYIEALTRTLKSSRLFGFFWEVTLSHDYLNYPMAMDYSYEKFLRKLDKSQYLNDTVLVLLSDHGIRWGNIRHTKQGRLEERLPFVQILLPPSFRENYEYAYNNIKQNSRRLTTPFDIHATLMDLIDLNKIKDEIIDSRRKTSYANERSISLFLPIPTNRTCKTAAIDDHWCTCYKSRKILDSDKKVIDAAQNLVKHLNVLIQDQPQCAQLKLDEILDASEMMVGTQHEREKEWSEIMVVVRTLPGGGVFEATLRQDEAQWMLAGTVSRLNLYGDQSRCVQHYQLKLFCFCQ
ncbi:unnamed protein product [Chilo suppressalis]|uniref:DUF229 domain containing protein n=1 Tax=Chilo suppressalis TaxID=168631 RepID=A0ABN8B699_CHISP|nr:unnamed protein product [Chilo suppressalis]